MAKRFVLRIIYGKEDSVPSGLKQMSNLERLNTLIEKVDCLIDKLN